MACCCLISPSYCVSQRKAVIHIVKGPAVDAFELVTKCLVQEEHTIWGDAKG